MPINGIPQLVSLANEQVNILEPVLREVFINETPILYRTPREFAQAGTYQIVSYDVRPRTYTLNAAITSTSATSMVLTGDALCLQVGDVLELISTGATSKERVEITADPSFSTNTTLTIRRAREGTTAVTNDATGNTTITLIGNSRTGGEINQNGYRQDRSQVQQIVQTFQYPIQVAGKANAVQNVKLPPGFVDLFGLDKAVKMVDMVRDIEYSMYYGLGEAPAAPGDRGKMKGLRTLINNYQGGANVTLSAGASFTKLNLVQKTTQLAINGGGHPDIMLVSTDFQTALATWSFAQQYFTNPRQTPYLGTTIDEFNVSFLPNITFIPSLQLKPGTCVALTSEDVVIKQLRPEQYLERGRQGDALQGDLLADMAIEVAHPGWHAWCEGITSYA